MGGGLVFLSFVWRRLASLAKGRAGAGEDALALGPIS